MESDAILHRWKDHPPRRRLPQGAGRVARRVGALMCYVAALLGFAGLRNGEMGGRGCDLFAHGPQGLDFGSGA